LHALSGAPTSFVITTGVKVGDVLDGDVSKLPVRVAAGRKSGAARYSWFGDALFDTTSRAERVCGRLLLRRLEVPAGVRGAHLEPAAPAGGAHVRAQRPWPR
jgi:hypothetical protein